MKPREPRIERLVCHSEEELPDISGLRTIPRGVQLEVVLEGEELLEKRQKIGSYWGKYLKKSAVRVLWEKPVVSILPLMSQEEVEDNCDFFLNAARDYVKQANELIAQYVQTKRLPLDRENPLRSLYYDNVDHRPTGEVGMWEYQFDGSQIYFTHTETQQEASASLVYRLEFGRLDPSRFMLYLLTTPEYQPLPVEIFDLMGDEQRVLDEMVDLGDFEKVPQTYNSAVFGIVPKGREKYPG